MKRNTVSTEWRRPFKTWLARAIHRNYSNETILDRLETHHGLSPQEARLELRRVGRLVPLKRGRRSRPPSPLIRIAREITFCTFLVLLVAAVAYFVI